MHADTGQSREARAAAFAVAPNKLTGDSMGSAAEPADMAFGTAPEVSAADAARPVRKKRPRAIELRDVSKMYGRLCAVDHLTLAIRRGEIFGLLGPNGSGKTTVVNIISGLVLPTSGTVRVMGYDIRHQARQIRALLGVVPQETALYEELTARANLEFHADLFGLSRSERKGRIAEMLDLVQLGDRQNSRVSTFSGGMKRRLALGRALLHNPQVIYLDEPTLGVDVQSRRVIWDHILNLRSQGRTILITTNYLEEAQALCDRMGILDHGVALAVDTPARLKQTYGGSVIELELSRECARLG